MASAVVYTYVNVGAEFFPCDSARPATVTWTGKGGGWAPPYSSDASTWLASVAIKDRNGLNPGLWTRTNSGQQQVFTTPAFLSGDFTVSQIPAGQ